MTADTIDTIDALIARYVAGSLPLPAHVLVETHLALKDDNRAFAEALEELAGDSLAGVAPVALSDRDRVLDAVLSKVAAERLPAARRDEPASLPAPLRNLLGFDLDQVPWRTKMPGFREYEIGTFDGCEATLFWIKPGRKIPAHTHESSELTLVLEGSFSDTKGRYGPGDISVADDSVDHRPIAGTECPCIGFAVTDGALRLTGPLHQRLGDILGA